MRHAPLLDAPHAAGRGRLFRPVRRVNNSPEFGGVLMTRLRPGGASASSRRSAAHCRTATIATCNWAYTSWSGALTLTFARRGRIDKRLSSQSSDLDSVHRGWCLLRRPGSERCAPAPSARANRLRQESPTDEPEAHACARHRRRQRHRPRHRRDLAARGHALAHGSRCRRSGACRGELARSGLAAAGVALDVTVTPTSTQPSRRSNRRASTCW